MSVTSEEIRSQPELWERAGALAGTLDGILPAPGEDAAVIGCGTSWFMAQAYAAFREGNGHGRTDAFAASEMPSRPYDVVVALSRSGTTTEVAHALMRSARSRTRGDHRGAGLAGRARRRRGRRARVRRRAVGRADALRHHRAQPAARPRGARPRRLGRRRRDRARRPAAGRAGPGRPLGVHRPRLDRRAGQRGGAEAARVGPGLDGGLPRLRVPPRPDQHRRAGRRRVVVRARRRRARGRPRGRRADRRARPRPARLARARPADRGRPRRGRRARPRPPAQPDPLRRPTRRCRSDPHQLPGRAGRGRRPGRLRRQQQRRPEVGRAGRDHDVARAGRHRGQGARPARRRLQQDPQEHPGQGDDRRRGRRSDAPEGRRPRWRPASTRTSPTSSARTSPTWHAPTRCSTSPTT